MTSPSVLVCPVCPRSCHLAPGETGLCHARRNTGEAIVPLAQNRPCSIAMDPMEKKPLFHFFPGSEVLSLGMAGCNLFCRNCQNAEISQHGPLEIPSQQLSPDDLVELMHREKVHSVAYTYTEPLVALEYVRDCARKVREAGGSNVLVSAAYVRKEALLTLLPFIDAANIDIKAYSDDFYHKNCGASLQPVLDAVRLFRDFPICLEITNLVIPSLNDSTEGFHALSRFVHDELGADVPLHFSRFFPRHRLLELPPTPEETLLAAKSIAQEEGLHHVYLGNTAFEEQTCCAVCHTSLITRTGYRITRYSVEPDGTCPVCHSPLYGRF